MGGETPSMQRRVLIRLKSVCGAKENKSFMSIHYGRLKNGRISPKNVLERLLINSTGDLDEECWEYLGRDTGPGGHKRIRKDDKTRMMVHRLAWEAFNAEPIPDGLLVLHKCDNPKCFNPHHLFLGTQRDNMWDCINKDRKNYYRKIKIEDLENIKISNLTPKELSLKYGVSPTRIRQIKGGK